MTSTALIFSVLAFHAFTAWLLYRLLDEKKRALEDWQAALQERFDELERRRRHDAKT